MDRNAFLWRLLDTSAATWSVKGPNTGLVQLLNAKSGQPVAAFAFGAAADLDAKFARAVKPLGKPQEGLQAKIVCDESLATKAKEALEKLDISILKCVERSGDYVVRYLPSEGKMLVSVEGAVVAPAAPASAAALVRPKVLTKPKVLIVDDSPTIRKILEKILGSSPELEVVGSVGLPSEVEGAIERLHPDVITLDIHLPEMNGVELLKRYLPKYRIPTVMISSISVEEGPLVLNALEAGAVDYIQKPSANEIEAVSPLIVSKVITAARASLRVSQVSKASKVHVESGSVDFTKLIAIGASTGGTEALKEVFIRMPEQIPPIVVVQHIPAVFSKAFANRLNELCPFEVIEGSDGDEVRPGRVIIAPGGKQMRLKKKGNGFVVEVDDSPPVNRHKPSVDVLFDSVAELCKGHAVGAILTGMGADGAKGLLKMKESGCFTVTQDEATCVVYGMPQAAFKLGAAEKVSPLLEIPGVLMRAAARKAKKVS